MVTSPAGLSVQLTNGQKNRSCCGYGVCGHLVRRQPEFRVHLQPQSRKDAPCPSPTQITVAQLSRLIGTPNAPVLIDVCIDEDFRDHPRFIPGAIRHPFRDVASLAPKLADERVVVVCKKGLKLSEGASAILRTQGIAAESLKGGNVAWRDAGQPLVPAEKLPLRNAEGRTVWVTRHRPKIDRIACPWLIRRFIDRNAQFLFRGTVRGHGGCGEIRGNAV